MNCPKCGAESAEGQNYCGGCGARLNNACSGCGTVNPPFFQYCGQCGRNLVDVGSLLLDRAGLILAADAAALKVIGQKSATVKGKPFSLFVKVDDLVVFYSHWNELMRSSKRQSVEVEMASTERAAIHARIEMGLLRGRGADPPRVHLALADITDMRRALQDAQTLQDLVNLIFSWADAFHPAGDGGRTATLAGVLEEIGLFAGAQYSFISRIDVPENCLVTDFTWRLPPGGEAAAGPPAMPIPLMARLFDRLTRDRRWIVSDVELLPALERKALQEWHREDWGAVMCHLICRRGTPVGIIGVAAQRPMRWSDHAVALVKLAGRLVADTLPFARPGAAVIQLRPRAEPARHKGVPAAAGSPAATIDIADIEIVEEPPEPASAEPPARLRRAGTGPSDAVGPRMKFGSDRQAGEKDRLAVFAGEDGKFTMTCPRCDFQDTVSERLFGVMGSAVRVQCPCGHRFRIIRELRRSYRKQVRLDGYFAQARESGSRLESGEAWGAMVVQDISRNGLKFTCRNAGRLRAGDRLQVRFNLDNANQSLIKKTAIVKSVQGDAVGCQFHGTDSYDAALGFYFL